MALITNPATGEILFTEDPTAYYEQGYRDPTVDELDAAAKREEYGTFAQQAQAQGERVLRGLTFGAVDGFGTEEENRARADVSQELSPVISGIASVVPDVAVAAVSGGLGGLATGAGRAAGRAALAEGGGLIRAGLSAARAGGMAALGAESVGTGLVGAGQQAYDEGRELGQDIGADAENALIWGGLNFGLGSFMLGATRKAGKVAGKELDDIAEAAEFRAAGKAEADVAARADSTTVSQGLETELGAEDLTYMDGGAPAPASPVDLSGMSLKDLGQSADGMRPDSLERLRNDPEFLASGRMRSERAADYEQGISLGIDPEGGAVRLQDGRHRLQVARENGLTEVYGTVRELGSGDVMYQGPIPIAPKAGAVRQGEREAVEAGVERALNNASRAEADDIVESAIGKAPEAEADSFGRQRRLYINREAIREVAAGEMQRDLSELVEDVGKVARTDKLSSISREVGENLTAQRAVAKGVAQDAAKFAGELRAEARAYAQASGKKGLQYAIPGQKSWNMALLDSAKQVQEAKTGRAMFEALDSFKRTAQDFKLSLEKGALNSENPIHHQALIPKIDSFASRIRGALEDSSTWGKAGDMQRAYNAVLSDKLIPHMRVFEEAVLKKTHQGYDGLWKMEGWENKIGALLKGNDAGNRRHVSAVLDGMDELAGVRRQFGDAKMADRIEGKVAKVRRTLGLADEVADAEERMHALGQIIGGGPLGGAMAGGLAGGVPGAVIGAALPGAVRGFVMGDLIQSFQKLSGATDNALKRGVDDWIKSSRLRGSGMKIPKLPALSPEAKQLRDVAARRGVSQGMALFMGEDESPSAAFDRLKDKLLDEEGFFNGIAEEYGTLQTESPETFMMVAARADMSRRYLLERMPANVAVSAANPNGYPPAREAIEDWAVYVNAVRHPMRAAQNIAGMRVQEVEALRTTAPRLHEMLQQRVIEGIARAKENGTQLDDATLARIGILFPDVDGFASPVFSKELGQVVRDYNLAQKMGGRSPSPINPKDPSPAAATVQGGPTFGQGF